MISIVLVTGFLGSGKTTFLNQIEKNNTDKKIVFLVNDFSSVDIDYQELSKNNENVVSVAGGSIFCQCLITEFVSQLKSIPTRFPKTDMVVIEASGIANPSTFKKMLIETKLNKIYKAEKIIAVVDPISLPILFQTLPNIKTQIILADQIILNKIDVADNENILKSKTIIKELNPLAQIIKTSYCEVDFDPGSINSIQKIKGNNTFNHRPQSEYSRYSYRRSKAIQIENLQKLIKHYKQRLYRIKGFILVCGKGIRKIDYDGINLKITNTENDRIKSLEFIFNSCINDDIKKEINELHM